MVALWEDLLRRKLDEESGKRLEELAEKINVCLGTAHEVDPAREPELRTALDEYRGALTEKTGERVARLTMIMRAFPAVAHLVREAPANV